jgi:hypothetical protein
MEYIKFKIFCSLIDKFGAYMRLWRCPVTSAFVDVKVKGKLISLQA